MLRQVIKHLIAVVLCLLDRGLYLVLECLEPRFESIDLLRHGCSLGLCLALRGRALTHLDVIVVHLLVIARFGCHFQLVVVLIIVNLDTLPHTLHLHNLLLNGCQIEVTLLLVAAVVDGYLVRVQILEDYEHLHIEHFGQFDGFLYEIALPLRLEIHAPLLILTPLQIIVIF